MAVKEQPKFKWRNSKQLQGVRSQLQAALNACTNGCYVEVGTTDLRNAIEVCLQAEQIANNFYKQASHAIQYNSNNPFKTR